MEIKRNSEDTYSVGDKAVLDTFLKSIFTIVFKR